MAGDSAPLRQILASFKVEIDAEGNLRRGHAAVDALKLRLEQVDKAAKSAATSTDALFERAKAAYARRMSEGGGGVAGLLGTGGGPGGPLARTGGGGSALALHANPLDALRSFKFDAPAATQGIRRFQAAVDSARASLLTPRGGFISGLFTMQNAIRGAVAAAGAGALLGIIDQIGGIGEAAAKLGVTNAEFQRLDVLAKQNATSVQALGTVFRSLANAAVDPTKETTAAFQKLGIVVKEQDGTFKSRQDLFFETAGALADVSDTTQRAAMAQDLFGRGAIELLPLLANGRAGIDEQRAALEKLAVVSDEAIASADAFSDSLPAVKLQLMALAGPVLEKVVIPVLAVFRDVVLALVDGWTKLTKGLNFGTIALAATFVALTPVVGQLGLLIKLGGGVSAMFKTIGRSALGAVKSMAPILAAFLILEDIFTFFTGGESTTGFLIDKLFGDGVGSGVQKTIVDVTEAFKDLWRWVFGDGAGEKAKSLFGEIGEGLRLMVNDALALIPGSGRTAGIDGLRAFELNQKRMQIATEDTRGKADSFLRGDFGGGNLLPVPGAYGPPTAAPAIQANGDRNVTINMGGTADPNAVATRVGQVLERDRNALVAGQP